MIIHHYSTYTTHVAKNSKAIKKLKPTNTSIKILNHNHNNSVTRRGKNSNIDMETQITRKKKRKKKDILETFATTKCNEERHTLKQNCRIHHIVVLHNKQEEPNTTRKEVNECKIAKAKNIMNTKLW